MLPDEIEAYLHARFGDVTQDGPLFVIAAPGARLFVMTDADSDRVRAMIPIAVVDRPDAGVFRRLLEANFAGAFDARYGIHDGVLWAFFLARLSTLSEAQLAGALDQVMELARTTGTSYSALPMQAARLH